MSHAMTIQLPPMKPILFSAPMVRAILEGRKTQARRIVKLQPSEDWMPHSYGEVHKMVNGEPDPDKVIGWGPSNYDGDEAYPCPYPPGTRLWVRETWCEIPPERPVGYFTDPKWIGRRAWYSADNDKPTWGGRWQSPCRMPRWASRITLKVSSVRAQRVQDISEEDARAEGATCSCAGGFSGVGWDNTPLECERCSGCRSFADLFALQWNEIHGPGAWERNDWVWALDFERE